MPEPAVKHVSQNSCRGAYSVRPYVLLNTKNAAIHRTLPCFMFIPRYAFSLADFFGFIHLGVRLLESGAFEGYLRYILLWISCFMFSNSESDIGLFVISISGIAGDFP